MKEKIYSIIINAPQQQVWDVMLGETTYPEWVKGFSANSQVVGEWKEGCEIDFIDPNMGGTRAMLEIVDEPRKIRAKHISGLTKNGEPETKGMENWIGTTEEYVLNEEKGITTLTITMHYHQDFEKMLEEGWNKSLPLLKELCEQ